MDHNGLVNGVLTFKLQSVFFFFWLQLFTAFWIMTTLLETLLKHQKIIYVAFISFVKAAMLMEGRLVFLYCQYLK